MSLVTEDKPTLAGAASSAACWNYIGTLTKTALQLITTITLARILGPGPFGLVAVAYILLSFGSLFSDAGFGAALVQRLEVSDEDIRFVFTCQVAVGLCVTAGLMLLSDPLGAVFGHGVAPVILFLAPLFAIQALGLTSQSLLRRRLDFKTLQICQIASYAVGYVLVGITAALLGAGVWSLVAAQLTQGALSSGLMIWVVRHPARPIRHPTHSGLLNFGGKVIVTNIVNNAILNLDNIATGHYLGLSLLGVYSRAFNTIAMPVQTLVLSLQGVLFSAASKAQRSTARVRSAYFVCLELIGLFICPLFVTLSIVASEVVSTVYGPRWSAAVPVLRWLAVAMIFYSLVAPAGPILWSRARVGTELCIEGVVLGLMAISLFSFGHSTVTRVAEVVAVIYCIRLLLSTHWTLRLVESGWWQLAGRFPNALLMNGAVALSGFVAVHVLRSYANGPALLLACVVVAGLAFLAVCRVRRYENLLTADARRFLGTAIGHLPRSLRVPLLWALRVDSFAPAEVGSA